MSDSGPEPPSSNRRSGNRYLACTMASVERADGEQRPALVHDLSESGALLLVRTTRIEVDDELTLRLEDLPVEAAGAELRVAHGVVVRVEPLSPGDSGPWLRRVAVRFHEPLPMYAAEIEGFRRRAQRLGISW